MVLADLGRFDQHADAWLGLNAPLPPQVCDASEHAVCAFRRLEREHVAIGDDGSLADIERTGRAQQVERERNIGHVARGRRELAERPFRHQNIGRDFVRANQTVAMRAENAADAG